MQFLTSRTSKCWKRFKKDNKTNGAALQKWANCLREQSCRVSPCWGSHNNRLLGPLHPTGDKALDTYSLPWLNLRWPACLWRSWPQTQAVWFLQRRFNCQFAMDNSFSILPVWPSNNYKRRGVPGSTSWSKSRLMTVMSASGPCAPSHVHWTPDHLLGKQTLNSSQQLSTLLRWRGCPDALQDLKTPLFFVSFSRVNFPWCICSSASNQPLSPIALFLLLCFGN